MTLLLTRIVLTTDKVAESVTGIITDPHAGNVYEVTYDVTHDVIKSKDSYEIYLISSAIISLKKILCFLQVGV